MWEKGLVWCCGEWGVNYCVEKIMSVDGEGETFVVSDVLEGQLELRVCDLITQDRSR